MSRRFDVARRRRIESQLDLGRHGRLAEQIRSHALQAQRDLPVGPVHAAVPAAGDALARG